jgi:UDP-glucose 6-dehydrogenase
MNDIINEVFDWNFTRGLIEEDNFNKQLEMKLLTEEITEFFEATTDDEMAKEICDVIFVAVGTLSKLVKCPDLADDIMALVIAANHTKSKDKVNGKIVKPANYVGPEATIKKLIERNTSDTLL